MKTLPYHNLLIEIIEWYFSRESQCQFTFTCKKNKQTKTQLWLWIKILSNMIAKHNISLVWKGSVWHACVAGKHGKGSGLLAVRWMITLPGVAVKRGSKTAVPIRGSLLRERLDKAPYSDSRTSCSTCVCVIRIGAWTVAHVYELTSHGAGYHVDIHTFNIKPFLIVCLKKGV